MEGKLGIFYGVSVGPGDPELLTLKACRVLKACPVIAAPRSRSGEQLALSIAGQVVDLDGKALLSLPFTMSRDKAELEAAWQRNADLVAAYLDRGLDVAMAVLGDVSTYSTYCYVMERLKQRGYPTRMIPGVTSFAAIAARLGESLVEGREALHILPASHPDQLAGLDLPGTKILMKSGRDLPQVISALEEKSLLDRAQLVANCGLPGELVCRDLRELDGPVGYYATIIVKEEAP